MRVRKFPGLEEMSPQDYIRYAKAENTGCPVCRSREVVHEHVNQSSGTVIDVSGFCKWCESSWQEEFHMVTYHSVKYRKEKTKDE